MGNNFNEKNNVFGIIFFSSSCLSVLLDTPWIANNMAFLINNTLKCENFKQRIYSHITYSRINSDKYTLHVEKPFPMNVFFFLTSNHKTVSIFISIDSFFLFQSKPRSKISRVPYTHIKAITYTYTVKMPCTPTL